MDSLADIYTDRPPLCRSELFLLPLNGVQPGQRVEFPPRGTGLNRRVVGITYPDVWMAGRIDGRRIALPANVVNGFLTLFDANGDEVVGGLPLSRVKLQNTLKDNALLTFNTPVDVGRCYVTFSALGVGPLADFLPIVFNYAD